MVFQVEISESARRDLTEIYSWALGDSTLAVKTAWLDELENAVLSLRSLPFRCPLVNGSQSVRVLFVGRLPHVYKILYRIDERNNVVRILHIRHGSRKDLKIN